MKTSPSEWQRLVAAARRAPADADASVPYGFSTRVVAQSHLTGRAGMPFARFSWRALGLAALVMAVTVAANFQPLMNSLADDAAALSDPVPDAGDNTI